MSGSTSGASGLVAVLTRDHALSRNLMAIRLLSDGQKFDLLITDVGLPGMNGRQLAEIVRNHLPDLPILFITGYAENAAIRADFLGTNMQMIAKPFQMETL